MSLSAPIRCVTNDNPPLYDVRVGSDRTNISPAEATCAPAPGLTALMVFLAQLYVSRVSSDDIKNKEHEPSPHLRTQNSTADPPNRQAFRKSISVTSKPWQSGVSAREQKGNPSAAVLLRLRIGGCYA
ncbi:hypothetical protein Trydic_g552 [Trypoxylus dichotomus]